MANKETSSSGGIGFGGLLTIVFITLKLLNKIDWSWWWVISPIWISVLVVLIVLSIIFIIAIIAAIVETRKKDDNSRISR